MFFYVYILQSLKYPAHFYTGHTTDLIKRLSKHNEGGCKHTDKYLPWKIRTSIAFDTKDKALVFEKYLKSHSGRAFAKKHF